MQLEDIKKLADLARVEMSDDELAGIAHDFDAILSYVGQIKEVGDLPNDAPEHLLSNIMRDDVATNARASCREKIIQQMPDSKDGFLKVKQIL